MDTVYRNISILILIVEENNRNSANRTINYVSACEKPFKLHRLTKARPDLRSLIVSMDLKYPRS